MGGNLSTNSGGLCCVKYGVTTDYVLGLEVVLVDGRVLRTGRRTVKGSPGTTSSGCSSGPRARSASSPRRPSRCARLRSRRSPSSPPSRRPRRPGRSWSGW
ncbi:FAD-binding protein [Blastococcus brunescens]|uniref:FAD-binding protein n=1 Tax=Blastococcus brunescens TaxID=1564165 RepID=A0ABZ1B8U8_9ACTN|nr:FAD-binding protein [Blastococcus sp. BMG 8361]WRL67181.1 FAD-binding protein [Blastococcus sp. BMG 8361]